MKGIQPFTANFLSYNSTKYYQNWSKSDLVIVKTKRVNFFETQCIYLHLCFCWMWSSDVESMIFVTSFMLL